MTADLVGARSAVIGKLAELALLSTTETSVYTPATGTGAKVSSCTLTNTSGSAVTVSLSIVKSGGTAGLSNRTISDVPLGADGTSTAALDLGALGYVGDGDFISAKASAGSAVALNLTGVVFSTNPSGGTVSGIVDDAIGTGGRVVGAGTVTASNAIGTDNNRYLIAALRCSLQSTSGSYTTYTTRSVNMGSTAMTPLVSVDFNAVGSLNGSVHLFGIANPPSGTTQTLTANVVKSGATFNLALESMSLSGVSPTIGATNTVGSSSTSALSLPVSSAAGHRPVFATVFYGSPQDFNQRVRGYNGDTTGATTPNWLILADALGASTVTASTSNTDNNAGVAVDLVPA